MTAWYGLCSVRRLQTVESFSWKSLPKLEMAEDTSGRQEPRCGKLVIRIQKQSKDNICGMNQFVDVAMCSSDDGGQKKSFQVGFTSHKSLTRKRT